MEKLMQHKNNCNRAIWGSILVFLSICAVFFLKGSVPVHAEEAEGISATRYIETSDGGKREYTGYSSDDGEYVVGDKLTLSVEINGLSEGQYVQYQWRDDNWNEIDGAQTNTLDITKMYNPDDIYSDNYSCSYTVFDSDNNYVKQETCYFYITTKDTITDYTSYITYNGKKYTSWSSDANQLNPKVGDKIQLSIEEVETEYENAKLTYQWYKQVRNEDGYYEDKMLEKETKDTIEVTKSTIQSEIYRCKVSDGNYAYYIEVSVPATKTLKVAQKINEKDYDNDNPSNNEFVAGDNVTLKIDATSEYIPQGEDKANITYRWLQYSDEDGYSEMEGKTDDTYTFTKGMGEERFACTVSDGNETLTYYFYAYSKLTLNYNCYINYNNEKYNTWDDFSMPVGAEAELTVEASSDYGTVNYKWVKYNYDTNEWDSLENTNSSITVKKTFRGQEQYRCIINDGNDQQELEFYLPPEKTLTAVQKINDKEYNPDDEDSSYSALKGTSITLEVNATSTYVPEDGDKANITYQWYKGGYNEEDDYEDYKIEGANESTYSFEKGTGNERYSCEVYDDNPDGTPRTYYFYVSPIKTLKNADGAIIYNNKEHSRWNRDFDVKEGDTLTLTASAKTTLKNGKLSYQWMWENEDVKLVKVENGTSPTLEIKKKGVAAETYYCIISDGNDECKLDYDIPAAQTLSVKTQKINGKEADKYTAEKGEKITLSVEAESSYTDKKNITYNWYDDWNDSELENETTSSCTVNKENGTQRYSCRISDGINYETVYFHLYQKDTLSVRQYINDEDTDEIYAVKGNSYRLSVNATTSRSSKIQYEWYVVGANDNETGYPSADNVCTDNNITVKKSSAREDDYIVVVSDGNRRETYYFSLYSKDEEQTDNISIVQYINDNYYEEYMNYTAEKFPITLKVEASAESGRALTYQWQKSEDYDEGFEDIPTAKGNTYEVSSLEAKRIYYRCVVSCGDSEDNSRGADFTLEKPSTPTMKITKDVKVNGTSMNADEDGDYIVKEGDEVTLIANVQKIDNNAALTYSWEGTDGEKLEADANTPNMYTIKDFDMSDRGSYTCTVSDGTDIQEAHFYVSMPIVSRDEEEITLKQFINGKQTTELEVQSVKDAIELKVEASSNKDSKALQYEWYENNDSLDTTEYLQKGGNTYKVKPENFKNNQCWVACRIKGTETTEYAPFYVYLKNYTYDFSSAITKDGKQQNTNQIRAAKGTSLKLEMVPETSDVGKKVSYAWYNSEGTRLSKESSVTVTKSTGKEIYRCKVNDGNYTRTYDFTLYPEEALIANAVINGNANDEYAAKAGETVKLEAVASSPKPVTYTWYRRGTTWEKLEETTSQLSRKVEEPETYVCVVRSENSLVRLYFYIYITNKDTSDTPNTPSNPDTPSTPSKPTTPTKPSTPAKPTTPAKPSKPTLKVGTKVTDKKTKAVYKVTGKNTVEYVKTTSKATSITIPATVTVKGVKCQVKSIAVKAFKGNKKIKKLTIPASVRKIGKQAFVNCKNLKTITIKTPYLTSKTVGAGAFKGIHAKAVIKVPKKQLKAYKKLLKAKGIGKKVVVKK